MQVLHYYKIVTSMRRVPSLLLIKACQAGAGSPSSLVTQMPSLSIQVPLCWKTIEYTLSYAIVSHYSVILVTCSLWSRRSLNATASHRLLPESDKPSRPSGSQHPCSPSCLLRPGCASIPVYFGLSHFVEQLISACHIRTLIW
jgi:hypothetical protein